MKMNVYSIAYPVTALGPGERLALWVAGCPLACPGCITPELWGSDAGTQVELERVLERLLAIDIELDGLTLTGGEPFEQPRALASLLGALSDQRPEWSVLAFSGYSMRELHKQGDNARRLLTGIDVLVAGRYVQKRPATLPLVASTNQRRHYLTSRGRSMRPDIEALAPDAADLAISARGEKLLVGVLPPPTRAMIHTALQGKAGSRGDS